MDLERKINLDKFRKFGETQSGNHGELSRSEKNFKRHLYKGSEKKTKYQHKGSYLKTIGKFFKRLKGVNGKSEDWQDKINEEGRREMEEGSEGERREEEREGERREEEREEERREEGRERRVQDWFGGRLKTLQEACTKFHNTSNVKVQ